ncbi:MAG TPA: 3-mercaptopyruvate sulfurtransferase [Stellaceae bacterium]|nr:3-mercaptopyruvate sulfurtransferase [Stellaceae bacterium]
MSALVSTEWLAARAHAPDIRIVDGSFKMPGVSPTAHEDYLVAHLPGAVFFDIDEIADTASSLPHMLPSAEKFASRMRKLGLGDGHKIVIYDGGEIFSAPRVWWMLRIFGHPDIAVLDGGLAKWRAEGRPLTDELPMPRERHFTARLNTLLLRDRRQMIENLTAKREQVIDARSEARFQALVAEPRPGLRAGHIPGSLNLPWDRLLDQEKHTLLPPERLRELFHEAGLALDRPVVCTCGSGVSACALAFALHLLGQKDAAIYDGSWSEWGMPGDTPVATGRL